MSRLTEQYSSLQYLYPPRPEQAVLPGLLTFYESRKWLGQIKKNGVSGIFIIAPDKTITCMNRHQSIHKTWVLPESIRAFFLGLPSRWYVFNGEILHMKTTNIKDTVYLYDCLVCDNEYLIGTHYLDRWNKLSELWPIRGSTHQYSIVSDNILIANNFNMGFESIYNSLTNPEDEGLVLRDRSAPLVRCSNASSNTSWLVKIRKIHKNYSF